MKHLKTLRAQKNLSQQKLADILHISQQSVYKYENGISSPDLDTVIKMADFFNCSVDYIIGYSDVPHKVEFLTETMLNEDELRLIMAYRKLTTSKKHAIRTVIESYEI